MDPNSIEEGNEQEVVIGNKLSSQIKRERFRRESCCYTSPMPDAGQPRWGVYGMPPHTLSLILGTQTGHHRQRTAHLRQNIHKMTLGYQLCPYPQAPYQGARLVDLHDV